jgi:glucose/arabinose dehydrogenase
VATIDRKKRQVIARTFLVNAPPKKPDVHSTPVIAADNTGLLHVLTGAHNNPFLYARATQAGDAVPKWIKAKPQTKDKQTYATLVSSSKGQLHTVYRQHGSLRYVQKSPGSSTWSKPREIVRQPKGHSGYTGFYHRLFIDHNDTLYLSFSFYEFKTKEEGRYPRALVVSTDNGASWHLATTASMQSRVTTAE